MQYTDYTWKYSFGSVGLNKIYHENELPLVLFYFDYDCWEDETLYT